MTASHPVFKPVTLPDFQNGNDTCHRSDYVAFSSESFDPTFEAMYTNQWSLPSISPRDRGLKCRSAKRLSSPGHVDSCREAFPFGTLTLLAFLASLKLSLSSFEFFESVGFSHE